MAANTPSGNAASPSAAPAPGGMVEPANRAAVAVERFQKPAPAPAERFEMRDPFAEVTYHAKTQADMVAKAEQLGSTRFTAVDAQGRRTVVNKVDGEWQRDGQQLPPRPPAPESAPEAAQASRPPRKSTPQAGDVVQLPQAAKTEAVVASIDQRAEREALVERLKTALAERYVIKRASVTLGDTTIGRNEYRYRGDTARVAFTESTFRLATDTNNPSVARSMVDVAQSRNWKALRVSGNEEFKRLVWLEASVRGVKTLGYEPSPTDLDLLKKEREARLVNRIEPLRDAGADATQGTEAGAAKASGRGGGGRKTVLAAIEAVLVAKGVPEKQREAVMAAATRQLAQRLREGQTAQVKVYDKDAPRQQPPMAPVPPQPQHQRDRAAPVR